jgi:hypothetical protein
LVLAVTTGTKVGWRFADNVGHLFNSNFLEGLSRSGIETDSVLDIFLPVIRTRKTVVSV